jgi:hypothetical protein
MIDTVPCCDQFKFDICGTNSKKLIILHVVEQDREGEEEEEEEESQVAGEQANRKEREGRNKESCLCFLIFFISLFY